MVAMGNTTPLEERLRISRERLAHRLQQQATYGPATDYHIIADIRAARNEIAQIKAALRHDGVAVADHPDDGDHDHTSNDGSGGQRAAVSAASPPQSSAAKGGTMSAQQQQQSGGGGDLKIWVAVIGALGVIVAAAIAILPQVFGRGEGQLPAGAFLYTVRVEEAGTMEPIPNAEVMLSVAGQPSLVGYTDSKGEAIIQVDASHANQTGDLTTSSDGYADYRRSLILKKDQLPQIIKLDPAQP